MKTFLLWLWLLLTMTTLAPAREPHEVGDSTTRFIFYAVLEGLYEDGLSTADVNQILMRKAGQTYFHFILACPICTATIWALEAYQNRPDRLYSLKETVSTFGVGLAPELKEQLYSEEPTKRLAAINQLIQRWLSRRMESQKLTGAERETLLASLEKKRKEGMNELKAFRTGGHGPLATVANNAPAYEHVEECAVCNGAVGKPMKLPGDKP